MTDNLVEAVAMAVFQHSDIGRLNPNMEPASMMKSDLDRQARAAVETVFDALIAEAEEAARFSGENGYRDISEVWQKHGAWIRAKKAEVLGE